MESAEPKSKLPFLNVYTTGKKKGEVSSLTYIIEITLLYQWYTPMQSIFRFLAFFDNHPTQRDGLYVAISKRHDIVPAHSPLERECKRKNKKKN